MSGGGGAPNPRIARELEEEKARQAELRKQAELSRMSRGRRLSAADPDLIQGTILGSTPKRGSFNPGP